MFSGSVRGGRCSRTLDSGGTAFLGTNLCEVQKVCEVTMCVRAMLLEEEIGVRNPYV